MFKNIFLFERCSLCTKEIVSGQYLFDIILKSVNLLTSTCKIGCVFIVRSELVQTHHIALQISLPMLQWNSSIHHVEIHLCISRLYKIENKTKQKDEVEKLKSPDENNLNGICVNEKKFNLLNFNQECQ